MLGNHPHIVHGLAVDGDVIDREPRALRHLEHRLEDLVGAVDRRFGGAAGNAPVLTHILALRAFPRAEVGRLLQVQGDGIGQGYTVADGRLIGRKTDMRVGVAIVLPILRAADQRLRVLAAFQGPHDRGRRRQVHLGAEGVGAGRQVHRATELAGRTGGAGVPFVDSVVGGQARGRVNHRIPGIAGRAVGGIAQVEVFELDVRVDVVAIQPQHGIRVDAPHGQEVRRVFTGEGDFAHVAIGIADNRPLAILVQPAPWARG